MITTAGSPLPAIGMVLLALSLFPVSDSIGKHLIVTLPIMQVVWARYVFHLAAVAPVALIAHGPRALSPRVAWRQLIRGVFLVISTLTFLAGLRHMALADSVAVLFVAPLIVTALAPLVLGERVGIRRYTAAGIGFIGALLIIRPGANAAGWYSLFPLAAGFFYACYILTTRRMAGTAPPAVTLTYTAIAGTVLSTALLPFVWRWPSTLEFMMMMAMGPIAALGHYMLIRAHERTQASLLAPFAYWQIVATTTIGYIAFGEFPDLWTWSGVAILVASGGYVTVRERRLALARDRAAGLR